MILVEECRLRLDDPVAPPGTYPIQRATGSPVPPAVFTDFFTCACQAIDD